MRPSVGSLPPPESSKNNSIKNEFNYIKILPSIETIMDHLPDFPGVKNYVKKKNEKGATNVHTTKSFVEAGREYGESHQTASINQTKTIQKQQGFNENLLESRDRPAIYCPHPPTSTVPPGRIPTRNTSGGKRAERLRTRNITSAKKILKF